MIESKRLEIIDAVYDDIDLIIEMESHKDNRDYLWIGTVQEHRDEIDSENYELWIIKTKDKQEVVGYAMAQINFKTDVFCLRRIAITQKGLGYGKEAMIAIIKYAFESFKMNRFWLDVYPNHTVGINLYESLGMHKDGVLRENYKNDQGKYKDEVVYSILRKEYNDLKRNW